MSDDLASMVPLAAAVAVGLGTGALVRVISLVALSAVVEVVGHEAVGYRHTVRVVERQARPAPSHFNV